MGEKRECVKMIVTEVEAEIEAAIEIGTGSVMEIGDTGSSATGRESETKKRKKEMDKDECNEERRYRRQGMK